MCVFVCVYVRGFVFVCVCTRAPVRACEGMCAYVCTSICVYIYIYIYIYTHIYVCVPYFHLCVGLTEKNIVECNGLQQFVAGDIYTKGSYTWQNAYDMCHSYNASLLTRVGSSDRIMFNCWQQLLQSVRAMGWSHAVRFWSSKCLVRGKDCGLFEVNFNTDKITFFEYHAATKAERQFFPICQRGNELSFNTLPGHFASCFSAQFIRNSLAVRSVNRSNIRVEIEPSGHLMVT